MRVTDTDVPAMALCGCPRTEWRLIAGIQLHDTVPARAMITRAAREFLARCIDSAELLDILMVLASEPDLDWNATTLSSRIFTVPQAAAKRLNELVERDLAKERTDKPGCYRLEITDSATQAAVEDVRASYATSRAEVVGIVLSTRRDPLASFSDAFKLRSE
jgi:hypothetical protein